MAFDPNLLMTLAAMMIALGCISGLLAGLLGVGGGIVTVPGLYYSLTMLGYAPENIMHVAVGSSLGLIVLTGLSSARAHYKRGSVDLALLKSWGPVIFIGVLYGAWLSSQMSGEELVTFFSYTIFCIAIYMACSKEEPKKSAYKFLQDLKYPIGFGIGAVSSLMGIGGATLSVPSLTLFKTPMRSAVGTAAAIGLIIAIPGVISYIVIGQGQENLPPFTYGYVNLPSILLAAPAAMLMAPVGAHISHKISPIWLRRVFAGFLVVISIHMFSEIYL